MNIIIAFLISVLTLFTVPPYATYENNDTTIDTPIVELNNHTLREVFEDILIDWNRQLPNGIYTYQERLDNGAYVLDRYVEEYTLVAGDIVSMYTYTTNVDYARVNITTFSGIVQVVNNVLGKMLVNGKVETAVTDFDKVANIGKFFLFDGTTDFLAFVVAKGTSLATAQADLVGTKIWYQLATPILNVWSSSLTVAEMDYYYSLYQELIDFDGATITYLDYDLHDIALIIFFGFLWLSLIILLKRKVLN